MQPSYKKTSFKEKKFNIRWRYFLFTYTKHEVSEFITCDYQRSEFAAIFASFRTQANKYKQSNDLAYYLQIRTRIFQKILLRTTLN